MNIKILDSGYVNKDTALASQTQLSRANRAGYNGSSAVKAFTLKTSGGFALSGNVKIQNKGVIGVVDDHDTSLISATNRIISTAVVLQKNDTTLGFEYNQLIQFLKLERTHGLKILYPDGTSDTNKTLIELMGKPNQGVGNSPFASLSPSEDDGTVSNTTPHIVGRLRNININDTPDGNFFRISFNFEVVR